uniref:Glycosyltransferase family 92 protein n=1 Tax=Ascaris lumbricoides TaxID=6252 RepID=A0A0M3IN66_ASCLU
MPRGKVCRCNYGGRFANAVLPKEAIEEVLRGKSSIFIGYTSEPHLRKRIRLIDSRVDSSRPRPHRLAICVSPIMQLAAWVLLPRFFEASSYVSFVKMWILHGATKFYAMVQSMTSEFDAMLRIYENDPTIDIERIPWGMLPTDEDVDSENNPNNQIIGAEQTLSLNDCLLRSRSSAEYVATVDYDEIFVVRNNSTLLELLDSFNSDDSDTSAFVFRSSFVFYDVKMNLSTSDQTPFIRHPSDLSFYPLRNVSLENEIYPTGSRTKVILRPEMTKSVGVHMPRDMEDEKYKTVVVDPAVALIFHLRLVDNPLGFRNNSLPNYELNKYIAQWEKQYRERIDAETKRMEKEKVRGNRITVANKEWPNRSHQTAQDMQNCASKYYLADETCTAYAKCFPNITAVRMDEWIFGESTTVVL